MHNLDEFALPVLFTALATAVALFSTRLSQSTRIPTPAFFLLGGALAAWIFPRLQDIHTTAIQRLVTLALVVLLFDGGMHIGWRRLRAHTGAVLWIGVVGTFATAAGLALAAHLLGGFDAKTSLLLGTALSPTDPAVVFSVLAGREISGRSGVLLEGESGANDPVGIALMVALLGTGGAGQVAGIFCEQMAIGAAIGVAGGLALRWLARVPLPGEGLYPLRTLAFAFSVYAVATVAHGSGFLAVFVAGIVLGDLRGPFQAEVRHFHSALASLGEITAFLALGLTVHLGALGEARTWVIGIALALLLAVVIRPLAVGVLGWPVRMRRGERLFVSLAGLKGAVPIMLGSFVLTEHVAQHARIYGIVIVVVGFSVIVQGSLVPQLARWFRVPMREVSEKPWTLGVRLRDRPEALRRYRIRAGAPADGKPIGALLELGQVGWISMVIRDGALVPAAGSTVVRAGDEVLVVADRDEESDAEELAVFEG